MRCTACGQPSDQLRHVEHHRRAGFGYRTTRLRLCPACAPAPVSPVAAVAAAEPPAQGAWVGAFVVASDSEGAS